MCLAHRPRYGWGSGEVFFDEVYVGPDHSTGFRCPVPKRSGVKFQAARPAQRGWGAEDLGGISTTHAMMRHESHLSQREMYKNADNGGLSPFDGDGHRKVTNERVLFFFHCAKLGWSLRPP